MVSFNPPSPLCWEDTLSCDFKNTTFTLIYTKFKLNLHNKYNKFKSGIGVKKRWKSYLKLYILHKFNLVEKERDTYMQKKVQTIVL